MQLWNAISARSGGKSEDRSVKVGRQLRAWRVIPQALFTETDAHIPSTRATRESGTSVKIKGSYGGSYWRGEKFYLRVPPESQTTTTLPVLLWTSAFLSDSFVYAVL
jgi:hypothetical protein